MILQRFSYKREKIGVPISTTKKSQLYTEVIKSFRVTLVSTSHTLSE
ncbi:9598_t:CDS:2 [Funneliformis mosseae]|uniref:9598_t:CDS:1 n=1 Tax=Funneliformis mosseae TaxID=27381 RepID=A0A9N9BNY9_FUNMO|nr:9598_t:CDS:2 [Funneliformis mosseae]